MKLILEASLPAEGAGIVRVGQALRFIRPPYLLLESPVLPETALQDAIVRHGFSAAKEEFSSWGEAIGFLNRQAAGLRQAMGMDISAFPGRDLLDVAPLEIVAGFLDRIEKELLPNHLFDHAEDLLLALLASRVADKNPKLAKRAVNLLQQNKTARERSRTSLAEVASRDTRFPILERQGLLPTSNRLAEFFQTRGCLFAPTA